MRKPTASNAAESMRSLWERLAPIPGGKLLFSKAVGRMAPYSGTIDARVVELEPGYSRVQMQDRKKVRNHLSSIHAIALMNLGELATGLAMSVGLPPNTRGIVTGLSIEYVKKARGLLTAECRCEPPTTNERQKLEVEGVIRDRSGDVVAKLTAHWLLGPPPESN